jgi:hypothetical protein
VSIKKKGDLKMLIFDRDKAVLDGVFGDRDIIEESLITPPDYKDFVLNDFFYSKLLDFVKENSYYILLPSVDDTSKETVYFFRNDKLKEEYLSLSNEVKVFFNNEICDYAEYRILKKYRKNLVKKF